MNDVPWKEGSGKQTIQCIQAQPTLRSLEAEERFIDIVYLVSKKQQNKWH